VWFDNTLILPARMRALLNRISPRWEFAIVVTIAFGLLIAVSVATFLQASTASLAQPHHNNATLVGSLIYEGIVFAILLPFLHVRGWTAQRLGVVPGWGDTLIGLGLFMWAFLMWIVVWNVTVLVSPITAQTMSGTHVVVQGISPVIAIVMSLINASFEEIFVCGYVVAALKGADGKYTMAVNASVAIRLLYHLYQGPLGVIGVIPLGLIFAYWFARTGRLWPVIVAHAAWDLMAFASVVKW
jgi:membrane protease YdiL (CAAX protease family)